MGRGDCVCVCLADKSLVSWGRGDLSLSVERVIVDALRRASEKGASKSSWKRGLRSALCGRLWSVVSGMVVVSCNAGLDDICVYGLCE